jgi:hypothetical protein
MLKPSSTAGSFRLQIAAFVAIAISYLLFAPNYEWVEHADGTNYGADFLQEWVGAKMIMSGQVGQLYDVSTFQSWQYEPSIVGFEWVTDQFYPPVYPPPHYVLFSPFALLPYRWAAVVWLLCLVGAAFFSSRLICEIVEHARANRDDAAAAPQRNYTNYLWIGMLLFPSLLFSITIGQKSVCWLLLACMTYRLMQCQREFVAGLVFGLVSIKPTLFFLLPVVMLRQGRWRFFAGASLTVCLVWGSTIAIVPLETWRAFASGLSAVGNYAENPGYRLDWSCNLMTLAYSLPAELNAWCKWCVCLPLGIYVLYCAMEDRQRSLDSPERLLLVYAVTLLVSPHTYHYDLCILLLPILCLVALAPSQGIAYFAMLSVGVAIAADVQTYFGLPVVPLLLIGIVSELRMRTVLHNTTVPSPLIVLPKRNAVGA